MESSFAFQISSTGEGCPRAGGEERYPQCSSYSTKLACVCVTDASLVSAWNVAVCVHVRGQCPVSLPLGPRVGARQHCMQRVRIGGQSPECARQNNRPSYGTQHDRD